MKTRDELKKLILELKEVEESERVLRNKSNVGKLFKVNETYGCNCADGLSNDACSDCSSFHTEVSLLRVLGIREDGDINVWFVGKTSYPESGSTHVTITRYVLCEIVDEAVEISEDEFLHEQEELFSSLRRI